MWYNIGIEFNKTSGRFFKSRQKNEFEKETKSINTFENVESGLIRKKKFKKSAIIAGSLAVLLMAIFFVLFSLNLNKKNKTGEGSAADLLSGFADFDFKRKDNDAFTLRPEKSDSLGVASDSAYILKSRDAADMQKLAEMVRFDPPIEYSKEKVGDQEIRLKPNSPLPINSSIKISLAENDSSPNEEYAWAYQVKDNFKVLHTLPRDAGETVPLETGIEVTFSHDNFKNYEKYFEINPPVDGRFEKHGRTLVYVPVSPLLPETIYTVTVKQGLPVENSEDKLTENHVFSFETKSAEDDRNGWRGVYGRMIETTTSHPPLIQIYSGNAPEKVRAELFRFTSWREYLKSIQEKNKLPWWSVSRENFTIDTKPLSRIGEYDLSARNNKEFMEFPQVLPRGFYLAQLDSEGKKIQIWIQVSDIAAYYNFTETDTIFWVNSTSGQKPIKEASVEMIGGQGSFATDKKGVVAFKTAKEIIDQSKGENRNSSIYYKIEKGDDALILPVSAQSRHYWWSGSPHTDDYWSYLYTDRPRYLPDDTIKIWGLLKPRKNGEASNKITVNLYKEGYVDYYYQPVKTKSLELDLSETGFYEGEIKLENLRPDYYTLELVSEGKVIRTKYITIKAYEKPAFELSVAPERKAFFAGEDVKVKIKSNFFEGTPVPYFKLKLKSEQGEKIISTDENGEAEVIYNKPYSDCNKRYRCWPSYERITVSPENSELAEISGEASVRVYGSKVAVKSEVKYPQAGLAEVRLKTSHVDIEKINENYENPDNVDGGTYGGAKISGEITKVTYVKTETGTSYDFINKKTYKNYSYTRKEEKIRDFSGIADSHGSYVLSQAVNPETSYRVDYRVYDEDGHYDLQTDYLYYYDGRDIAEYSRWENNYYALNLNKEKYSLGDEVVVSFKNNDSLMPEGENRYLFLQLKNGLQEYEVADRGEYRFSFSENDIPDVDLNGVYFNGVTYIEVGGGYWGDSAVYDFDDRELEIKLSTDKAEYDPGQEVVMDIEVQDKKGAPTKSVVNVNLVDEAYYSLFEDVANPLESLYLPVASGSLFSGKTHYNLQAVSNTAEKGGCFAAGTPVLMADGTEKPIEEVEKGDRVLTFSDPLSRQLEEGEVTETWKHTVAEYMIINQEIKVTPEHRIFSNNRFIDAGLLKEGDWLLDAEGGKVYVSSIERKNEIINVYNLRVDPQHSFFAGGVYVHNEEKGGGPREFFTDAVVFRTVATDSSGKAQLRFNLPDNITSWRATIQAISRNIFAGATTKKIAVSLPVFADVTIGQEYLPEDAPVARMRAFGTALDADDKISFFFNAESLGVAKSEIAKSQAFKSVFMPLPELSLGEHFVTYNLETSRGNDAVKLPISVVSSRLQSEFTKEEKLTTETKIEPVNNFPVLVLLTDEGRSRLYSPLKNLSWQYGDRVDQKYVRQMSGKALVDYYNESKRGHEFNSFEYQLSTGGIALLPYSSSELELSSRIASLGADKFDRGSLAQYFFEQLEKKDSTVEEATLALFGLAELGEPVLPRLEGWIKRDDLGVKEKIYMAQALHDVGAVQWSRGLYADLMDQYAKTKGPHIIISASENLDETFNLTALMSVLSASLGYDEGQGMNEYVAANQELYGRHKNSENLYNLEMLNYILRSIPKLESDPVKIKYSLSGKEESVELEKGDSYSFQLAAGDTKSLQFNQVEGDAGISMRYVQAFDAATAKHDPDISLRREYYVQNAKTNNFNEQDLVEVRLYPSFSAAALAGQYQLTDILPSGLAPVAKIETQFDSSANKKCNYWNPYNADGQMVKYRINKLWRSNYCGGEYIYYYARVRNKGVYKAESAIIQSFENPELVNYSEAGKIKIE